MGNRTLIAVFLFVLIPGVLSAQSENYTLSFAPDAWYNEVDGIRLGARVLGEREGTFLDGPHRLEAGVWLGTAFPDLPISYYVSFTEPVLAISSFGNEGNVRIRSSIRTGYSRHELSLNKRWQNGFDEFDYQEFSLTFSQEKLFDIEYRPYPLLWQEEWKSLFGAEYRLSQNFDIGQFNLSASIKQNVSDFEAFKIGTIEIKQEIPLGEKFEFRVRGFSGYTDTENAPEYLFGISYRQPAGWLQNGVSRAKGTLPGSLLDDGLFHISGHANLRGYTNTEFRALSEGNFVQYNFVNTVNAELEFPNFVNSAMNGSILGDFVQLRSYLFADAGNFFRADYELAPGLISDLNEQRADAGIGVQFSINIPDYLGKDRGFAIRYEIPFWLSHPEGNESSFKFRNLIGIGAVISL